MRQQSLWHAFQERWPRFALAVVLAFFLARSGYEFLTRGWLSVPGDFICFWSAGKVANEFGYAAVYDLTILLQAQRQVVPEAEVVLPMFYPPVFLPLFQLLAQLPIFYSYWLWLALNLVAFVAYLFFFLQQMRLSLKLRVLLLIVLSVPVFQNFFAAQVNLFLMLGVGEFLRLLARRRDFWAGMMLGLLLIKYQLVLPLFPYLAFQRKWKTLLGLLTISFLLTLASALMLGFDRIDDTVRAVLQASQHNLTAKGDNMVNWRMVGVQSAAWGLSSLPPAVVSGAGMFLTGLAVLWLWHRAPDQADFSTEVVVLLGTLATASLLAWHAHIHMGIVLIPPLLYLFGRSQLRDGALFVWSLMPLLFLFGGAGLLYLKAAGARPLPSVEADFFLGLAAFVQNVWLLGWSVWRVLQQTSHRHILGLSH